MTLKDEVLRQYIQQVYKSKYSILRNGCFQKSFRIVKEARRLGHSASLMVCISHPARSALFGLSLYTIHVYALIDGTKIDVAFDPTTEKERTRNEEVKMTRGIPIPWV